MRSVQKRPASLTALVLSVCVAWAVSGCGGGRTNQGNTAVTATTPAIPVTQDAGSGATAAASIAAPSTPDSTTPVPAITTAVTPATAPAGAPIPSNRMGAVYGARSTRFSLWSPDSADVTVTVAGTTYPMAPVADVDGYSGVYAATVTGDLKLASYAFAVNGVTVPDPYSAMVQPGTMTNIVIDPAGTALAAGWAARPPLANRESAVVYEVHVRDFTIDASAGVDAAKRGKYAGMVQAGTTVNGGTGAANTGIDYLVALGVTHVQLMPLQDFGSCGPQAAATCYNWGYDPVNFNVPEERYSATPNDPAARIREFKAMVDAFHQRGIRVVLDVVYNHTQTGAVFSGITSKYYGPADLTGVCNTIDPRQPMVARMIRDSLEYWAREYNVDGFRFDLMGAFDYSVVAGWAQYLDTQFPGRTFLMYGEPWVASDTSDTNVALRVRYGTTAAMAAGHVGVFNGNFRDSMKGDVDDGAGGGFIFNSGIGTDVAQALRGSPRADNGSAPLADLWARSYTSDPEQTMNYVDVHDNLCLADKVSAWAALNGQSANTTYLERLQQFALSMVVVSQGIPLLNGGSEILRTKQGDANSYQSPDAINAYRWTWRDDHAASFAYVQKLIKLRSAHPALRMADWQSVHDHAATTVIDNTLVTMRLDGTAAGDSWTSVLIIANSGSNRTVTLPAGNWQVAVEQSSAAAGNDRVVTGSFIAEGTAVSILHQ